MIDLGIIVPVYNEAGNIQPLAAEIAGVFQPRPQEWQLVFVDDASTDDTWQQIEQVSQSNSRVRGIRHDRNRGQSAALWTGIRHVSARVLATLDGDGQNDPADLPMLLAALDRADLVCGVRLKRQDTWLRRFSSWVARRARHWVFGVDFRDSGCGLRVLTPSILAQLAPFNGFHRFLPVLIHYLGGRVVEIPVHHRPRVSGRSKYGVWNRLGRGLWDLLGVTWWLQRQLHPAGIAQETGRPQPPSHSSAPSL